MLRRTAWKTRSDGKDPKEMRICGKHLMVDVRKSFTFEAANPDLDNDGRQNRFAFKLIPAMLLCRYPRTWAWVVIAVLQVYCWTST